MIFSGKTNEYLRLQEADAITSDILKEKHTEDLMLIWSDDDDNHLKVDGRSHVFGRHQIICLTEFHNLEVESLNHVRIVRFNRPFYCVLDNDTEVGCKGILFFGATQLPVINIPVHETEKFEALWKMFVLEMEAKDSLQMEMLTLMLKRLLIMCTRLYKEQSMGALEHGQIDLIREFNFLVETHYKTIHTVAEYAEIMNKSPKTLSNLFAKLSNKTPLQLIQERKMLEARRLLRYTDMCVKTIAYQIGFEDIQTFSRFFKNQEGMSPTEYKEKITSGIIANI